MNARRRRLAKARRAERKHLNDLLSAKHVGREDRIEIVLFARYLQRGSSRLRDLEYFMRQAIA